MCSHVMFKLIKIQNLFKLKMLEIWKKEKVDEKAF